MSGSPAPSQRNPPFPFSSQFNMTAKVNTKRQTTDDTCHSTSLLASNITPTTVSLHPLSLSLPLSLCLSLCLSLSPSPPSLLSLSHSFSHSLSTYYTHSLLHSFLVSPSLSLPLSPLFYVITLLFPPPLSFFLSLFHHSSLSLTARKSV